MPPAAASDFYAELGLERTSSQADVTRAYRELARKHHPDKNPDNAVEATAQFQRIQAAYETLADPDARSSYDVSLDQGRAGGQTEFDPGDDYYTFDYDTFPWLFTDARRAAGASRFSGLEELFVRAALYRQAREEREYRDRKAREKLEREQADKKARQERREAAEKAAEAEQQTRLRGEKAKQEQAWAAEGAVTDQQKKASCLHSEKCGKVPQRKKLKCGECGVKRGMVAYECPHCLTLMCQLCQGEFARKRREAAAAEEESPEPSVRSSGRSTPSTSLAEEEEEEPKAGFETGEPTRPKDKRPARGTPSLDLSGEPTTPPAEDEGPDPQYDGWRHKRCGALHRGGDNACWVLHPEFRRAKPASPLSPAESPTVAESGPAAAENAESEYDPSRRHRGCGARHKGGDAACWVLHPELRRAKPGGSPDTQAQSPAPGDGEGSDAEYDGGRHRRCGALHWGGDAACFLVHPELCPKKKGPTNRMGAAEQGK